MEPNNEKLFAGRLSKFLVEKGFSKSNDGFSYFKNNLGAATVVRVLSFEIFESDESLQSLAAFFNNQPQIRGVYNAFIFIAGEECYNNTERRTEMFDRANVICKNIKNHGFVTDFIVCDISSNRCLVSGSGRVVEKAPLEAAKKAMDFYRTGENTFETGGTGGGYGGGSNTKTFLDKKGNPMLVYTLMGVNVLIFVLDIIFEFSTGTKLLEFWGIQNNVLIFEGEVWRLFTAMFLHADVAHLAGNMLMLMYLGNVIIRRYSDKEFLSIYLFSGLCGNLLSLFFLGNDTNSLGASGAIMGLGGVLIYRMFFGADKKSFRNSGNFTSLAITLGFNLIYGLVLQGVNNFAHYGGFVSGFLIALIIDKIRENNAQIE